MNTKAIIVIPPRTLPRLMLVEKDWELLRVLQGVVGGLVQPAPDPLNRLPLMTGKASALLLVNEEGLLLELPRNVQAQAMLGYAPLCGHAALVKITTLPCGEMRFDGWEIGEALLMLQRLQHNGRAVSVK